MPIHASRRRAAAIVALTGLGLAAACGGALPSSLNLLNSGFYTLQSINGKAVPVAVATSGDSTTIITGETLDLEPQGLFFDIIQRKVVTSTTTKTFADSTVGGWSESGANLIFQANGGSRLTATVAGGVITLTNNGFVSVYTK